MFPPLAAFLESWRASAYSRVLDVPYTRALVNGVPLLVVASFAVVCLAIRQTFSPGAKLMRQPGLILSFVVLIVAAATYVGNAIAPEFLAAPDLRFYRHEGSLLVLALYAVGCLTIRQLLLVLKGEACQSELMLCLMIVSVAAATVMANPIDRQSSDSWQTFAWKMIVFGLITNIGRALLFMLILLKVTGRYIRAQSAADSFGRLLALFWIVLLWLEHCRWFLERAQIM